MDKTEKASNVDKMFWATSVRILAKFHVAELKFFPVTLYSFKSKT